MAGQDGTPYELQLTLDDVINLLAFLERLSDDADPALKTLKIRDAVDALRMKVEGQTGLRLDPIHFRDLTAEARALRESAEQRRDRRAQRPVRKACTTHVLSMAGRCLVCGETPEASIP